MSIDRDSTVSTIPPNQPATIPTTAPVTTAIALDATPTSSEIRVP